MSIFDISEPGARVVRSTFGGGWIVPLDAAGFQALQEFFDEPAAPLAALCGDIGYIVESWQSEDLAEHLRSCNVSWEIIS